MGDVELGGGGGERKGLRAADPCVGDFAFGVGPFHRAVEEVEDDEFHAGEPSLKREDEFLDGGRLVERDRNLDDLDLAPVLARDAVVLEPAAVALADGGVGTFSNNINDRTGIDSVAVPGDAV